MLIKNISQLIKEQIPVKYRLFEGSSVHGKILSLEEGKGAIKLYDGTIIPAVFISDNNLEKDKFTKFIIQSYDGNNLVLKISTDSEKETNEESLKNILKNLNIPSNEGKNIIMSLIKFNLPATDDNILSIYKNLSFLNNIKNMTDQEILNLVQRYFNNDITNESKEFFFAKEIIHSLQTIDADFLSFFIENDIPHTLDNMLKGQQFIKEKFFLNSIVDAFKHTLGTEIDSKSLISFDDVVKKFHSDPELCSKFSIENVKNAVENIDILKHLYNNYNLYAFNLYENGSVFKNNIIIKNKYKASKLIDSNDIKAYISIETPKIGIVEGYVYKKNRDLLIALNVDEEHMQLFKNRLSVLNKNLTDKGYNVVNLSVEKKKINANIVNLSNFFSDVILKELDVKV